MVNVLKPKWLCLSTLVLSVTLASCFCADRSTESLPAAQTEASVPVVEYSSHTTGRGLLVNLGPTGARAWMRGYNFVVMRIDQGSPAHTRLELADVIMGVNGKTFGPDVDPRIAVGNAIEQAESSGKPIVFNVLRKGKPQDVDLPLPKLGAFSNTWPYDCEKSAAILRKACRSLALSQMPNGEIPTDTNMGTLFAGLLLTAANDPLYLDAARRAAHHTTTPEVLEAPTNNWRLGYSGMLLAEYYLATGDDSVLPQLKAIADALAKDQKKSGSWCHGTHVGYGPVNLTGMACAMALLLAEECGVPIERSALDHALAYFGQFAGWGSIPAYSVYYPGNHPDNNGKNSQAAVLMHLAGMDEEAKLFTAGVVESYWQREEGHTGGFFSLFWGALAAVFADEESFRTFMDYQKWYYNMSRTWDGEITMLPYHEAYTAFHSQSYISFDGDFTTGGIGLAFALPQKHIRILGAPASVFGTKVPLTGDLLKARDAYLARDWATCDELLKSLASAKLSESEKSWYAQLQAARTLGQKSIERTLLEIESNVTDGAPYRALEQFEALKRCYGEDVDPRFALIEERFKDGKVAYWVTEGRDGYDAYRRWRLFAARMWVPQGRQAKARLRGMPPMQKPIWEPLSPVSDLTPQSWKVLQLEKEESAPENWRSSSFEDQAWQASEGIHKTDELPRWGPRHKPVVVLARRTFAVDDPKGHMLRLRIRLLDAVKTSVFLNGVKVAAFGRYTGTGKDYAPVELDKRALSLLKSGKNVLALRSDLMGVEAAQFIDVGLEINREYINQKRLPPLYADTPYEEFLPPFDGKLRVRETKEKVQQKLEAEYAKKDVADMLGDLGDYSHYRRYRAVRELVMKGPEVVKQVMAMADNPDWKVRCSVSLMASLQRPQLPWLRPYMKTQKDKIIAFLSDKHHVVRLQAINALLLMGEDAKEALPELVKCASDPNEFVRTAALKALKKIDDDGSVAAEAAQKSLRVPSAHFDPLAQALRILKANQGDKEACLQALLAMLANPPEGGRTQFLAGAIELAVELDPNGERVIPVLIDTVADKTDFSLLRHNMQGKAVEFLASYGPKAKAAIPILEALIEKEEAKVKDKGTGSESELAATCRAAIEVIRKGRQEE